MWPGRRPITATSRKREKFTAQLTWLANKHELDLPEDRRHERVDDRVRAPFLCRCLRQVQRSHKERRARQLQDARLAGWAEWLLEVPVF